MTGIRTNMKEMLTLEEIQTAHRQSMPTNGFDPYLYHTEMPLKGVYYPLGFPLEIATNSAEVLKAADESWGAFKQQYEMPPLQFRFGVLESESTECPAASTFRAQRNLIVNIADNENFCINDIVQGFSFAWFTTATVSRRNYFRYHFLDGAVLCHIANRYSVPIHAACVALEDSGVLLCGDSGAGKSSLSFACARAGWTYVTDDASYLINGRTDRQVVGNCHLVRFRPSAAELFPEVAGRELTPRAAAKPSIEVSTASIPGIHRAAAAHINHVVFLNRQDGNIPDLTPFSKDVARKFMEQCFYGMDEMRRMQSASIERLLTAEVLELRYRDLDWAVQRLERLVLEKRA
jgi:hypothetical protein